MHTSTHTHILYFCAVNDKLEQALQVLGGCTSCLTAILDNVDIKEQESRIQVSGKEGKVQDLTSCGRMPLLDLI